MTVEEVRKRVEEIRKIASDYERAHSDEDSLYSDVLAAIANGTCVDTVGCARAALETQQIDFSRYCA